MKLPLRLTLALALAALGTLTLGSAFAAGSGWSRVTVNTTGDSLRAMSMLSASSGYAVGGPSGTQGSAYIFNGSWTQMTTLPGSTPFLYGVDALNTTHVWAVGNCNAILFWNGTTWTTQNITSPCTATSSTLRSVAFMNPAPGVYEGWAVGSNGTILFSPDGGAHWQPETSGDTQELLDIVIAPGGHIWAVGNGGMILESIDLGLNWTSVSNPSSGAALESVDFSSSSDGWVAGFNGTTVILRTTDGGTSWTNVSPAGLPDIPSGVSFVSPNQGWISAFNSSFQGIVISTTNGAAATPTFTPSVLASGGTGFGSILFDIQFLDACHGDTVGVNSLAFQYTCAPPSPTPTPTPKPSPSPGVPGLGHPPATPANGIWQLLLLLAGGVALVGFKIVRSRTA